MRLFRSAHHVVCIVGLAALGQITSQSQAEDWAGLFDATSHDFGAVARGQRLRHTFKITNGFEEPLHIAKCNPGATSITKVSTPARTWLNPSESVGLEICIDTSSLSCGRRGFSVDVFFHQPAYRRVRLDLECYIRSDLVLTPGEIAFGKVRQGNGSNRTAKIEYAGELEWKIPNVTCKHRHVDVRLDETIEIDISAVVEAELSPQRKNGDADR